MAGHSDPSLPRWPAEDPVTGYWFLDSPADRTRAGTLGRRIRDEKGVASAAQQLTAYLEQTRQLRGEPSRLPR